MIIIHKEVHAVFRKNQLIRKDPRGTVNIKVDEFMKDLCELMDKHRVEKIEGGTIEFDGKEIIVENNLFILAD